MNISTAFHRYRVDRSMLYRQSWLMQLLFSVLDFSNFTLNTPPVCFLCDNSDCILPTKIQNARVDEHWWLCDEYPHCLDQTDEDNGKSDRII